MALGEQRRELPGPCWAKACADDRAGYQFIQRRWSSSAVRFRRIHGTFRLGELREGWITDGQIEKFDEVAEAVKRVVAKSGTKTADVVMAMPQSAVITKKIMLPAGLREEELEVQVESEANQYIPFSLDEVSLDFCVIGPSPTSVGDVEVLIAASRKDRVQGSSGPGRSRRPEARGAGHRVARLAAGDGPRRGRAAGRGQGRAGRAVRDRRRHDEPEGPCATRRCSTTATRRSAARSSPSWISRQYGFSFEEAEQKKLAADLPDDYEAAILDAVRRQPVAGDRSRACSTSSPARRTTRCIT